MSDQLDGKLERKTYIIGWAGILPYFILFYATFCTCRNISLQSGSSLPAGSLQAPVFRRWWSVAEWRPHEGLYSRQVQYSFVQFSVVLYSLVQYNVVQYSVMQYNSVQYSVVQYNVVHCSVVQYSVV